MQTEDRIDPRPLEQGDLRKRAEPAITEHNVSRSQSRAQQIEKLKIVRSVTPCREVQNCATAEGKHAYQAQERKSTAGLLLRLLRVKPLIGRCVRHRKGRSIDDFNAMAQPEIVFQDPLLCQACRVPVDLLQTFRWQSQACLTIRRRI